MGLQERAVGSSTETTVTIESVKTTALLDTGASVSTVSENFHHDHLAHLPIQPLDDIIVIECADGEPLPYTGYIEAGLASPEFGEEGEVLSCLLLVVPNSKYNARVPVLLGTNVLDSLMEITKKKHGLQYLQTAKLTTPWYISFRCMTLREKELRRNQNRLAWIRSAHQEKVTIRPNASMVITGCVHKPLDHRPTCALVQPALRGNLDTLLDITPAVINYDARKTGFVDIHIANVTTQTVVIPPKTLLCELQPVAHTEWQEGNQMQHDDETSLHMNKIHIDSKLLTPEQAERVKTSLRERPENFSQHDHDVGLSKRTKHKIHIDNEHPFKERHRRIPPGMYDQVREHLQKMLDSGIIRRSYSPWSSNVVWVKKKDGSLRQCVDFRQLNARTIKDSYALPRIEELLDALAGSKFFTVLDLKSGYHQVEIAEEHKERTAFTVAPLGFFEYNRMAMGLANAPATYQRLMEECLEDLHLKICLVFLDDIIIFGNSFEEHLSRVEQVLDRLKHCGLKLNPKKCFFFQDKVKYVGHIVSADGIEADPEKCEQVKNWPRPTSPEEVRRFLGFTGYYRRFVEGFASIAKPLTKLMPNPVAGKKRKGKKNINQQQKAQTWIWGPEQETAFQKLKDCLSSPPILGFADYTKSFELHTDASISGLGAVLYQMQEGKKRVIAYASRGLSKSEKNYPAHKLEFLALKWAITEKFSDYLYGHQFSVFTDNNPLTYVLTTARLDATGHRWLAALASYNFDIQYRPGTSNADADALSRLPALLHGKENKIREYIPKESVRVVCKSSQTVSFVDGLTCSASVVDDSFAWAGQSLRKYSDEDIRAAQHADSILGVWMDWLEQGQKPPKDSSASRVLHQTADKLKLMEGKLYRETVIHGQNRRQLVLPSKFISEVLIKIHNEAGHPGKGRTLSLLRERFFWPGMTNDVEGWINRCPRCICRKTPANARAPLVNILTTQPLELVCIDFLTLETSKGGYQYVLVITDHFTRFAQAIPTRNMTAKTTAEAIFNNFVVHYGLPKRLHSDQGANFESRVLKELCEVTGCQKSRTTAYHPMGNGMTERFNRTLLDMLGTLEHHQKVDWKSHIAFLVHAYNCTPHESTNFSPYSLMFGRDPHLPVDLVFGLDDNKGSQSFTKYVDNLRTRLKESFNLATAAADKARAKQKATYDLKRRGADIIVGDRVLVKRVAFDGRHKLADKWEESVYKVVAKPNKDIPVYVVKREDNTGRSRTLHRNLLLPLGSRLSEAPLEKLSRAKEQVRRRCSRRRGRRGRELEKSNATTDTTTDTELESCEEDVMIVVQETARQEEEEEDISQSDSGGDAHSLIQDSVEDSLDRDEPEEAGNRSTHEPNKAEHPQEAVEAEEIEILAGESSEGATVTKEEEPQEAERTVKPQSMEEEQRPPPRPAPRPSLRTRTTPAWMKTGDYIMSHQVDPGSQSVVEQESQAKKTDILEEALQVLAIMPEWVTRAFVNRIIRSDNAS